MKPSKSRWCSVYVRTFS